VAYVQIPSRYLVSFPPIDKALAARTRQAAAATAAAGDIIDPSPSAARDDAKVRSEAK